MLKRVSTAFAAVGLAGVLAFGGASAANATTTYIGGGTLDHGVDIGYRLTWSNYYHFSKSHGSTACSTVSCTRSDRAPARYWSFADRPNTLWGNQAFYWF